jgi:hypothetical protein
MNNDLQILDQWAKTWLVDFNPKKTKALIISKTSCQICQKLLKCHKILK